MDKANASFNPMDLFGFSILADISLSLFMIVLGLPFLLFAYPMVWSRECLIRFVKWRYPYYTVVENLNIRSILDQGRNHGVYTLMIQGRSIADGIRSHLYRLSSTRKFLKATLITRWGLYVWKHLDNFNLDNHLVNSPCSFRGRPITESNIQEYVSDITSKFLSVSQSPWQVHVINCFFNGEESQVCLVRVHHLLLRQEHLTVANFLPMKYSTENWVCQDNDSPLMNLYSEPSALPRLYEKLTENFSNHWNDFLCNNDPIERPEILKKPIGLFQNTKIGVIVLVCTLKELTRQYKKAEGLKYSELLTFVQREANKRNFVFLAVVETIVKCFNPIEMIYLTISWFWYATITIIFKTPILLLREIKALKSRDKHQYSDTVTSMLWCYSPLIFQASLELLSITWIILRAPKLMLEELVVKHPTSNRLQSISSCGRKLVAWSEEIDIEVLEKISNVTGASETEILLTATTDALKEYFRHSGVGIPDAVLATAKFVSQRAIFVKNHETRGILCLALPTRTPLFEDDLVEVLQMIQKNIQEARSKQCAIYAITAAETSFGLVSSCLPSIILKLFLNHLSKRYSLSLTHVDGVLPVDGVDATVYWRPPQGNSNMSITLHRQERGVRLGVMVDAMIGPQHAVITKMFPKSLRNLSLIVGVPRTPSRSPSPTLISPTTSPGY